MLLCEPKARSRVLSVCNLSFSGLLRTVKIPTREAPARRRSDSPACGVRPIFTKRGISAARVAESSMRRRTRGNLADNGRHLRLKTHFQTLVELVNHQIFHSLATQVAFVQMVVQTAGSRKHYLGLHFAQLPVLVHSGAPSIEAHGTQAATHVAQNGGRLKGQLASRYQHHRLHLVARRIDAARPKATGRPASCRYP